VPAVVLTLLFALVVGGLGGRPGLGLAAGSLAAFGALLLAALPPGRRLARMAHAAWIVLVGAGAALVAALLLAVVDQGIPLSGVARLAVTASVFVFVAGAATMRRIALARR
jgi:hypothetical protein